MTEHLKQELAEKDQRTGPMIYAELKQFCKINGLIPPVRTPLIPEKVVKELAELPETEWGTLLETYQQESSACLKMINIRTLPEIRTIIRNSVLK